MDHELKQTALVHIDPIGMCSVTYGMEKKRSPSRKTDAISRDWELGRKDLARPLHTHTIQ